MSGPGRNDPCPCGSGKKYKRCCLTNETASTSRSAWFRLNTGVAREMMTLAMRRFHLTPTVVVEAMGLAAPSNEHLGLLVHWALYHHEVEGRTVADWFLDSPKAQRLSAAEGELVERQQAAWLSVWRTDQVSGSDRFQACDLLTGATGDVEDEKVMQTMQPGQVWLGRVVDVGDATYLAGMYPRSLPTRGERKLLKTLKKELGLVEGRVTPGQLKDGPTTAALVCAFERAVLAGLGAAPPPAPQLSARWFS